MAKQSQVLTKRLAIAKANTQMVIVVAVASFVTVFCLVACKTIWSQYHYQAKVVGVKEQALKQLKTNTTNFDSLSTAYHVFDTQNPNIIGGQKDATGDNDGSNSKIVIDSLPSSYDFPALTSSIEKILTDGHFKVTGISGIDDQLNQQGNVSSATPTPVEMPFSFTVSNANYNSVQDLIKKLQNSIRPIQIDSLELSGGVNDMSLTVNAHTYYQPARAVTVTEKVVK